MSRLTSGLKTTGQNPHHHLLEAQQLGLVHDGEGEAAGEQGDAEEDDHGPEVADLKQTVIQCSDKAPVAHLHGLGPHDEPVSVHGDGHVGEGGHVHRHTREGLHKPGQE